VISERLACQSLIVCLALSVFIAAHAAEQKPTNDKLPAAIALNDADAARNWRRDHRKALELGVLIASR